MNRIRNPIFIDEQKLRNALKNNEFTIYYQPQVNMAGSIIGVEALARWFTEEDGMIPPNYFIPILEKYDLIYEFQMQLFSKACYQINCLNTQTKQNLKLSINISPILMNKQEFFNDIKRTLNHVGMDAQWIEFEITESYDLTILDNIQEKLKMLRQMNLSISLDDFGKGYSSIKYLIDYQFDYVKIDKNYLDIITKNPEFLKGMMTMIQAMGCKVVSEGIESSQQVDILKTLNCDVMQGYYFYKPMPYKDLLKIFMKHSS